MRNNVNFLSKGLFEQGWMQTRIKTFSMTAKEKFLGYFLGPTGIIVFIAVVRQQSMLYYTSVVPIDKLFGTGTYLAMTTAGLVLSVVFGVLLSYITEHTVSKAGRLRPYILIAEVIMLFSGVAMFCCPFPNGSIGELAWLFVANVIYYGIATPMYYIRNNLINLATRNLKERSSVTLIYNLAVQIIPGILLGLIVSNFLYYNILIHDTVGTSWRLVVVIGAIMAVPLMLVEYFYSRERITEENLDSHTDKSGNVQRIPVMEQVKSLLSNKYYLIALIMTTVYSAGLQLQGIDIRTNYCQWVLGANAKNNLQIIYQAVAMAPMGLGIPLLFPLTRKFGTRKVVMVGGLISAAGGIFCMLDPRNITAAFVGSFVLSIGVLSIQYLNAVFNQQASDTVEYRNDFRPEGALSAGIITAVLGILVSPLGGLYATVLVKLGYDPYSTTGQNSQVFDWIIFVWFGVVVIQGLVYAIGLFFFDVEKSIDKIHAELKERHKRAVLARGDEWVDPEEQERRAKEESSRIEEENRIKDLRTKCEKRALDFEVENQKYLDKVSRRLAKKVNKSRQEVPV